MADIFAGTEPPRWLESIAKPIDTNLTGQVFGSIIAGIANARSDANAKNANLQPGEKPTSFWEQIPQSIHTAKERLHDPLWDIHQKSAQLNIAQQGLNIQATQDKLNYATQAIADKAADQKTMAEWLQKYPTREKRRDAPTPMMRSEWGTTTYDNLLKTDNAQENQRSLDRYNQNFNDAYRKADNATRADIDSMMGESNGKITREMWDRLGKGAENTPPVMHSTKGKEAGDEQALIDFYGEDHPMVKSFREKVAAATKKTPKFETWTDKNTGNRYLQYGTGAPHLLAAFSAQDQERLRILGEKMKKAQDDDAVKAAQDDIEEILKKSEKSEGKGNGNVQVLSITPHGTGSMMDEP